MLKNSFCFADWSYNCQLSGENMIRDNCYIMGWKGSIIQTGQILDTGGFTAQSQLHGYADIHLCSWGIAVSLRLAALTENASCFHCAILKAVILHFTRMQIMKQLHFTLRRTEHSHAILELCFLWCMSSAKFSSEGKKDWSTLTDLQPSVVQTDLCFDTTMSSSESKRTWGRHTYKQPRICVYLS